MSVTINEPIQWHKDLTLGQIKRELQHENKTRSYRAALNDAVEDFMEASKFRTKRGHIEYALKKFHPKVWKANERYDLVEAIVKKLIELYQISAPLQEFSVVLDKYNDGEDSFDFGMRTMDLFVWLEKKNMLGVRVVEHDDDTCSVYIDSYLKLDKRAMEVMENEITKLSYVL